MIVCGARLGATYADALERAIALALLGDGREPLEHREEEPVPRRAAEGREAQPAREETRVLREQRQHPFPGRGAVPGGEASRTRARVLKLKESLT